MKAVTGSKDGWQRWICPAAAAKKLYLAVISGANGGGAVIRLQKLGITNIFLNVRINLQVLENFTGTAIGLV